MAFEAYSQRARQVIFIARHIAGRHGSSFIHVDHLLLALIYEDQGEVSNVLLDAPELQHLPALLPVGAHEHYFPATKASELTHRLEECLPKAEPLPSSADIPLSSEAKQALAIAGGLVTEFGQKYLDPVHILAGILKQGSGGGVALLRQAGVSDEQVMDAIRGFPGRSSSAPAVGPGQDPSSGG